MATGAEPRRLSLPGADLDGIYYLRTLPDSERLRERIEQGGKLVVVGAGWIGCEVAAAARLAALPVTVIDPGSVPLEYVFGAEVGAIYRDLHADHGVEMLLRTGVEAFEGDGRVEHVRTDDGRGIDCDFVVAGIGAIPRTELASGTNIVVHDGLHTNEYLENDVKPIFAAGDVANTTIRCSGECG